MEITDFARAALSHFKISGTAVGLEPYGNGHINQTFLVTMQKDDGRQKRYILQAINQTAFRNPDRVIGNISKVTDYLRRQKPFDERAVMTLIASDRPDYLYYDDGGNCWRMYTFVENSLCLERPESTEDFRQCAIAFGRFQCDLSAFPAAELFETIPHFHDTPDRYRIFLQAAAADCFGRAKNVAPEIEFVKQRADFCATLFSAHARGELPLRVTHNDTKSNNVLLDAKTRKALCVIDLDTIMPGFSVNDFGDAIRFGASTAAEDEKDLSKVHFDIALFEAYTQGFIEGCGGGLLPSEIMLLPEGAKMMTLECGMRFLTDYLSGDTYFRTAYPEHNLDRCRTQFKLVAEMEAQWADMKAVVRRYC